MTKKSSMSNSNSISGGNIMIYVILGLILLGLIGLLVYYLFFHNRNKKEEPTPSPSSTPSTTKPSSPSPTKSKNELSVDNLANIKSQLSGMGDNYNTLSAETKERIRYCYLNPDECAF
jgi:cytoskeletal protein RodZ